MTNLPKTKTVRLKQPRRQPMWGGPALLPAPDRAPGKGKLVADLVILGVLVLALGVSSSLIDLFTPLVFVAYRLVLVATALLLVTRMASAYLIHNERVSSAGRKVGLLAFSLFAILLVAEGGLSAWPQSHYVAGSLSSRLWMSFHWDPVNELGYRDEAPWSGLDEKREILVIGDSHTAGYGLESVEERFGEHLEGALVARGERNVSVRNAGWPGANIRAKHRRLASYPVEPDVVVLQYLTDDIHGYVLREGEEFSGFKRYADIPEPLHPIVDSSFLANWIYWSVPRASALDDDFGRFEELYANPAVLQHHLEDVGKVIDWAEARDVELVAVVFPFLQDLEMSAPMTGPVESLFRSRGVELVDVTSLVDDMPVEARLVSRFDPHPSAEVHRRVGEALAALPVFRSAD